MKLKSDAILAGVCTPEDAQRMIEMELVLAAHNAAGLAMSYLERENFAAARRKLTQALASINQLNLEG